MLQSFFSLFHELRSKSIRMMLRDNVVFQI
jgi:hypothetical protein